jgi:hypothetical protein
MKEWRRSATLDNGGKQEYILTYDANAHQKSGFQRRRMKPLVYIRSAIKTVPAANSDHVTARAVRPSPEATMMKRMYRLRKKQDTQLYKEQATAILTFEGNDEPLYQEGYGGCCY